MMKKKLTGRLVSLELCTRCKRHGHFLVDKSPTFEFCNKSEALNFIAFYRNYTIYPRGVIKRMRKLIKRSSLPPNHLTVTGALLETVFDWNDRSDGFEPDSSYEFHLLLKQNKRHPVSATLIERLDLHYELGVHPENRRVH